MKKVLLACALRMTFGLAADALGQGRYNRGERQGIRRGVRSGQLTRDEARQSLPPPRDPRPTSSKASLLHLGPLRTSGYVLLVW